MATTKKAPAVVPFVVYNDLAPAENDTGVSAGGEILPSDPRLEWIWRRAAIKATRDGYCGHYDTIAKHVGAPSRAQMGIPSSSWELDNYTKKVEANDAQGNPRTKHKVTFKGTTDFMGNTIDFEWVATLVTSGTREDINDVITQTMEGPSAQAIILTKLNSAKNTKIKAFIEEQKTNSPVSLV